jgi:hypothetical protein
MTDDQLLLANAYVDGDLDADERARAEADDEVMAEVARLRVTISALRDVEPPDEDRREAALAAALRTSGGPAPVAPPVPLRSRGRWWAAAGIAAGVVAIAIAGIAVLRVLPSGDDDDTALELTAQPEPAATDASRAAAAPETPSVASATTAASATTGVADQAAVPTTTVPARPAVPETTAGASVTVIASPDDLVAFAMEATPQTTPPDVCPGGRYVAPAIYTGVSPPVAIDVYVVGSDAVARDATSCVEVARARLP